MDKHALWLAIVLVLLVAVMAAAHGNQAQLRVVHAIPGTPPVDVLANDQVVISNLAFKAISPYTAINVGSTPLRLSTVAPDQQVLVDHSITLNPNTDHTVVAVGRPGSAEALLEDDNNLPPSGQARVRFVHASPNAPSMDVFAHHGPLLFASVPYQGVGDYVNVAAGTYDLLFHEADAGHDTDPTHTHLPASVEGYMIRQRAHVTTRSMHCP